MYCKGDGKVTFTRPYLILGKVTFDEYVNILAMYCKSERSYTFTKILMALIPNPRGTYSSHFAQ